MIAARQSRGVAILMVVAILAGLMALAAPFILSMVLHARTARGDLNALRARSGSEAATSHALAQLFKNAARFDPASEQPPITTLNDLKVTLDFPAAAKEFDKVRVNVQDPAGLMWSAKVEDEQGKINLTTAPPALLGNLLGSAILVEPAERGASSLVVDDTKQFNPAGGSVFLNGETLPRHYSAVQGGVIVLIQPTERAHAQGALVYDGRGKLIADYQTPGGATFIPYRSVYEIKMALAGNPLDALQPSEFARIERHLTVQSGAAGPLWGHGERPKQQGPGSTESFSCEKAEGFTLGGRIRVVTNGEPTDYARILQVQLRPDGSANLILEKSAGTGDQTYIQPEMHHPININTASTEVLEACFMGLCMAKSPDAVRRQAAQVLADFIRGLKQPIGDNESLKKVLDQAHAKGILSAPQRDAVYINATEPSSPKLRTSTVPFCYFSYGSYTIEGTGVVNAENGLQLARHTTRQLLTMPTPWPGHFKVEWQAGFERLVGEGMGSKVVTFPMAMGKTKYKRAAPTVRQPALHMGGVRLDVGECGPHKQPKDPTEWIEHCEDEKDGGYRQDGYDMSKRQPFVVPGDPNAQQPRRSQTGLACLPTAVELWYKPMRSGQCVFYDESLEEDRNRVTFAYDPAKGLLVQVYDAGYECQDSKNNDWTHLRRKPVEFIYPTELDHGEWYHVAASWKTGRPNGQEVRLDAQPKPPREEIKFRPGVRLAAAMGLTDDSFELEEIEEENDFPKAGAVQIGEEIIEYQVCSGNSFQQCSRGARLSAAARHKQGELVVPFGFSINLAQDLPVGGATLVERVEKPSLTRAKVSVPPNSKIRFILDTEVTKLPVDDATSFPKSGFITVGGELICYGRRTATSFEQLQRGQGDNNNKSTPRNINDGSGVSLASIQITDSSQYDDYGIVQIDDDTDDRKVEWIAYSSRQAPNGKAELVARLGWHQHQLNRDPLQIGNPPRPSAGLSCGISEFRNHFGIGKGTIGRESAHEKKAKVIPVVRMSGPHCGNQLSPYGDQGVSEISIVERGNTQGDLMWVKQAYIHQWANTNNQPCPYTRFTGWHFDFFVGLNDFVSRRYPASAARILKWPSGELPDAIGARRLVGADRNQEGKLTGYVDEIKVNTFTSGGARLAMTTEGKGISGGDEEILLEEDRAWPRNSDNTNVNLNWPTTGGLVRIEDELLFYKSAAPTQFQYYADVFPWLTENDNQDNDPEISKAGRVWVNPCTKVHEPHPNIKRKTGLRLAGVQRGVLKTKAAEHPPGAQALLLDGMAVSLLTGNLNRSAESFSVANAAGFPDEGYAWIDNEVVSWLEKNGNTFNGCKHFHGRFGTTEADHDADAIVRCLPFRYWDREAKFYDGEGLAYIQAGYAANDAIWDGLELQLAGTEERPRPNCVKPRVLVRFDGNPNWDVEITNQDGGLFEFRGKEDKIPLKGARGGIHANQAEMRVYWEFRPGAFIPGSDWKSTFTIEKMRATYYTPLLMRRLDEIEKR